MSEHYSNVIDEALTAEWEIQQLLIADRFPELNPVCAAAMEKHLLEWILRGDITQVVELLSSPLWKQWATDPRRITDPADDPEPKLGFSKWFALPLSHPFTPVGWFHDLFYRNEFSKGYRRREVDRRFLMLCNEVARSLEHEHRYLGEAHAMYRIVRAFGGTSWKGKP